MIAALRLSPRLHPVPASHASPAPNRELNKYESNQPGGGQIVGSVRTRHQIGVFRVFAIATAREHSHEPPHLTQLYG